MCGIVGYNGTVQAAPLLLEGLSKLEYRGYDSAGLAVVNDKTGNIDIVKAKGRLKILAEKTDDGRAMQGTIGIGHTRWATHGEPSIANAHPHYSDDRQVVLVHNGIIENYVQLREKLEKNGYTFYSETDTEVAAKLIHYYYQKYDHNPIETLCRMMYRVRGSYSLGILFKDRPGELYAVRKDSPLVVGVSEDEKHPGTFIASDVTPIMKYTRHVYYLDNFEIACLKSDSIDFWNIDREHVEKEPVEVKWDTQAAEKSGYEHFMIKEIHEQPKAVRDTINAYVKDGQIDLSETGLTDDFLKSLDQLYIVACGSAADPGTSGSHRSDLSPKGQSFHP